MTTRQQEWITSLRFRCTGCGDCCTGGPDHYVEIRQGEKEAIRDFLGLSKRWFRRRYVVQVYDQMEGIRLGVDGRCPFLLDDHHCRVYPVRPLQCRTYPWWPELIQPAAWKAEARRCEGIGRGPVIAPATIRRHLGLPSISQACGKITATRKKR
ncbi:MAG: YkgJ family cysteine cluster protein [Acidiferrobacterales bacterium]